MASRINFTEFSALESPSTPGAGRWTPFFRPDGMYIKDDAGNVIGPFIEEAPSDGNQYARKDNGWIEVEASGTSLTNADLSPTTADLTLTVNTRNFVDASGLTADRALKFPTGTDGDQIEIRMIGEHASYACILRGDTAINLEGLTATEWDRLWHSGMALQFAYRATDGWRCTADNRKVWRSILLTGDVASVDFQNIPAIYKNMKIDGHSRTTVNATGEYVMMRFNNDSGANYDGLMMNLAHSATLSTSEAIGQTSIRAGATAGNTSQAGDMSAFEMLIPNYSSASMNKSFVTPIFNPGGRTTGSIYIYYAGGQWRSTAAINRVTLLPQGGGNFKAGSRFSMILEK